MRLCTLFKQEIAFLILNVWSASCFCIFFSKDLNLFLIICSVRSAKILAILAHLVPFSSTSCSNWMSYSIDHLFFLREGLRWLHHLSRHSWVDLTKPEDVYMRYDTNFQLIEDALFPDLLIFTCFASSSSSSSFQGLRRWMSFSLKIENSYEITCFGLFPKSQLIN